MDAVTTEIARVALDAAWIRQRLIAANIANHATPGYGRLDIEFEKRWLEMAAQAQGLEGKREESAWIDAARRSFQITSEGGPMSLDHEMLELTRNTLHYQAVLTALERYGEIKSMAVREGGR